MSRVSIQSKLLVMLLLTSILSAAVVGAIGFQSGRTSLRGVGVRPADRDPASRRRGNWSRKFTDLEDSLIVYTRGATTAEAIEAFSAGFDQLNTPTINPDQWQIGRRLLQQPVREEPKKRRPGTRSTSTALLPTSNAQRYLQAYYTAPFNDWDKAIRFDDARDGSAWSAANARFNDFFRDDRRCASSSRTHLLLDTRGNVVYSAYKGVDLGTNILNGPYPRELLRDAYEKALASNARRLRRRHRLRRLPARRRAHRLDGVAGRPARAGRRCSRAPVPDLQDQPADDRGQEVGSRRDGQDRRDHSWSGPTA